MSSLSLHTCEWIPDTPARAHVLLVHGLGEHIGRYEGLAAAMTREGWHVHGFDHPGHGKSPGNRGYVNDFPQLVDNLVAQLDKVRAAAGDQPIFLLGHSMGGLVVTHALAHHKIKVHGAVLSSPLLAIPDTVSPLLIQLAGLLGTLTPWLPVDRLETAAISRLEEEVAAYEADPLIHHGPILARTGAQLSKAIQESSGAFESVTTPFLVVHGTADRLAPVAGSRALHERASSGDKTATFYEGGYHELLNDNDREAVRDEILGWIRQRVG